MASHAGAARFAYNAGLAHVKEAIDNGEPADWSHYGLLRWWNANKDELAVNKNTGEAWWSQNSKEAYSMGLRSLAQGFSNWSKSRKGQRKGKRVGFPKFKSKNNVARFAYSTNFTAPTASDPYGLRLSCIGRVHCMENVYERVADASLPASAAGERTGVVCSRSLAQTSRVLLCPRWVRALRAWRGAFCVRGVALGYFVGGKVVCLCGWYPGLVER